MIRHFRVPSRLTRDARGLWRSDTLLGCYVRIGALLIERFAQDTAGLALISGSDLAAVANCAQAGGAVQRMRRLVRAAPAEVVFAWGREQAAALAIQVGVLDPSKWGYLTDQVGVLGLRNFAKDQGFKNGTEIALRSPSERTQEPLTHSSATSVVRGARKAKRRRKPDGLLEGGSPEAEPEAVRVERLRILLDPDRPLRKPEVLRDLVRALPQAELESLALAARAEWVDGRAHDPVALLVHRARAAVRTRIRVAL